MAVACKICSKIYSTQYNLNKHLKSAHLIQPVAVSYDKSVWNYKCLQKECNNSFRFNEGLIKHLENVHDIRIMKEKIVFKNLEEFKVWKYSIEESTNTYYTVTSHYTTAKGDVTFYRCNRTGKMRGKYSTCEDKRKRLMKSQGSNKLNRACTSEIKLLVDKNIKFVATWVKSHYGHTIQLQHIRLHTNDRLTFAAKLINGVSPAKILDTNRDQIGSILKRKDLLTNQDLINIKRSYKINVQDGVKHEIDSVSVDLWVKECEQLLKENPVLFYKRQGEQDQLYDLGKEDFCLLIMNLYQQNMLQKFGANIITVDSTHGLNRYNFELTTLMVVDDSGEGFPVAFMITNRKDTYINTVFFDAVKKKVGVIKCKIFMSDITEVFYNAWVVTMGSAKNQLYCSWHVDRAWQINLKKICDKDKRNAVYKTIKCLQQNILEINDFKKFLHSAIQEMFADEDTKDFGEYFLNNYSTNFCKWAYCFRTMCGINTNMRLESMHKVIKYFYLNGKKVKRLDIGLHGVLRYIRNKTVDKLIKLTKGSYTIHTKRIVNRHNTAKQSSFSITEEKENNCRWQLKSEEGSDYFVQKVLEAKCCDFACLQCRICIHMFTCTCTDYLVKFTICKHIHFLFINKLQNYDLVNNQEQADNNEELKHTTAVACQGDNYSDIENLKLKMSDTYLKFQSIADVNNIDSEVIAQIHTHLNIIDSLLNLPKQPIQTFDKNVRNMEPGNKKIEKQQNFYSTQKRRKLQLNMGKPNEKEVTTISKIFLNSSNLYISEDASCDHDYCLKQ